MYYKICIGILIIALLFYYLLMVLQAFNFIKLTNSDEEEISWFPFYYLFKKNKKKETAEKSNNK